ncbi:unnamed protein product [Amoebophrya sp. A25]|nr:unnamed protein product [Amoebophrya sp. A25]|eukprot:GSA25T00018866001.1
MLFGSQEAEKNAYEAVVGSFRHWSRGRVYEAEDDSGMEEDPVRLKRSLPLLHVERPFDVVVGQLKGTTLFRGVFANKNEMFVRGILQWLGYLGAGIDSNTSTTALVGVHATANATNTSTGEREDKGASHNTTTEVELSASVVAHQNPNGDLEEAIDLFLWRNRNKAKDWKPAMRMWVQTIQNYQENARDSQAENGIDITGDAVLGTRQDGQELSFRVAASSCSSINKHISVLSPLVDGFYAGWSSLGVAEKVSVLSRVVQNTEQKRFEIPAPRCSIVEFVKHGIVRQRQDRGLKWIETNGLVTDTMDLGFFTNAEMWDYDRQIRAWLKEKVRAPGGIHRSTPILDSLQASGFGWHNFHTTMTLAHAVWNQDNPEIRSACANNARGGDNYMVNNSAAKKILKASVSANTKASPLVASLATRTPEPQASSSAKGTRADKTLVRQGGSTNSSNRIFESYRSLGGTAPSSPIPQSSSDERILRYLQESSSNYLSQKGVDAQKTKTVKSEEATTANADTYLLRTSSKKSMLPQPTSHLTSETSTQKTSSPSTSSLRPYPSISSTSTTSKSTSSMKSNNSSTSARSFTANPYLGGSLPPANEGGSQLSAKAAAVLHSSSVRQRERWGDTRSSGSVLSRRSGLDVYGKVPTSSNRLSVATGPRGRHPGKGPVGAPSSGGRRRGVKRKQPSKGATGKSDSSWDKYDYEEIERQRPKSRLDEMYGY